LELLQTRNHVKVWKTNVLDVQPDANLFTDYLASPASRSAVIAQPASRPQFQPPLTNSSKQMKQESEASEHLVHEESVLKIIKLKKLKSLKKNLFLLIFDGRGQMECPVVPAECQTPCHGCFSPKARQALAWLVLT